MAFRNRHYSGRRPSVCLCVQKLGIPTEIGTDYIAYYDTPVEDLSNGESINIMPGIRKTDYRETARRIRVRAQHSTGCGRT